MQPERTTKSLKTTTVLANTYHVRLLKPLESLLAEFSPFERIVLYVATITLAISSLGLLLVVKSTFSNTIPSTGGSITEGEVGTVRFINPILASSAADQDLTQLVYSGLMMVTPAGTYVPDLASSYRISPDGTTYTFTLKDTNTFQDGSKVTAEDVLYTIGKVQDEAIKSPLHSDWIGVVASSPDLHTIVFKLPHSYTPFIENTTLGIIPKHLWSSTSNEEFSYSTLNIQAIGSGPYRINTVIHGTNGLVTKASLIPFNDASNLVAKLSTLNFNFYQTEEARIGAYNTGLIDGLAGITPNLLSQIKPHKDSFIVTSPLPRIFGVFFNQSHNKALIDPAARMALDMAVDKAILINSILHGYGSVIGSPIPTLPHDGIMGVPTLLQNALVRSLSTSSSAALIDQARSILINGGWVYDLNTQLWKKGRVPLSLTLATADTPELVATTNAIARAWHQLGVVVTVAVYPIGDFNTTIIRPRNYDAIVFGEVVGRQLDLYAFWHSSERLDPGLNVALYANPQVDLLLTEARSSLDVHQEELLYSQAASIITKDMPAIFLYSPQFLYIIPSSLKGVSLGTLTSPSERFLNVREWYTDTENVWNAFAK